MSPKGASVLTGAAGEHFVLYQLHRKGVLAAQLPTGAYFADLVVFDPENTVGSMVQVKTRTHGGDKGWHMQLKHEGFVHPRLFYTFVDLEPQEPIVYIVPSRVVAEVLKLSHASWLATPGKARPHKDNPMRRILPKYAYPVAGYDPGWLGHYRDRWDYLTGEPSGDD